MTHNDCDLLKDLVLPIQTFLLESNVTVSIADSKHVQTPKPNALVPPPCLLSKASAQDQLAIAKLLAKEKDSKQRAQKVDNRLKSNHQIIQKSSFDTL